jgi:methylated-DNA-[protein]-cysteine S-methyltransferase
MTSYRYVDSPIGPLLLAADDSGLRRLAFAGEHGPAQPEPDWCQGEHPLLDRAASQLEEYFAGRRQSFDLPLAPCGTPFQVAVWQGLERIPYGETISYAELATRIGRPQAMRAVGAANGRNPIAIIVPCHRVIGADGSLTGFGGGLPRKRFLLELEASVATGDLFGAANAHVARVADERRSHETSPLTRG